MSRLDWSTPGTRFFETGVDQGVLYLDGQPGVVWTGLTAVEEAPTGGEPKSYYLDGVKYLLVSSREEFAATISAYTYPDDFTECDGTARVRPGLMLTQQRRKMFGLSYRTKVGNDVNGVDHAYKLHLVYNAMVAPATRGYTTMGAETEASDFSWSIVTKPPSQAGYKHSAHIVIDSRDVHPTILGMVEDVLYGNESEDARLPTLEELIEIFDTPITLTVTDLGGGLFRIEGPDDIFVFGEDDRVQITGDTVTEIDPITYSITSE